LVVLSKIRDEDGGAGTHEFLGDCRADSGPPADAGNERYLAG